MTHSFVKLALVVTCSAALFSSLQAAGKTQASEAVFAKTQKELIATLQANHYQKMAKIDDALSQKLLEQYIDQVDQNKRVFLQSDIDSFQKYKLTLDEQLLSGKSDVAFTIYSLYRQRLTQRYEYVINLLNDKQFDFTLNENMPLERQHWPKNDKEAENYWRQLVKTTLIESLLGEEELEQAYEDTLERFERNLKQVKQIKDEEIFSAYLNAFTSLYDPHTSYMTPIAQEDFDINMSLQLSGIGAELSLKKGITTINRLIKNGPAEKGGNIQAEDQIIAVAQGAKGEYVNIIGWRLDDVVQLIRGEVNSVVRLKIRKLGNTDEQQEVSITRQVVTLEDQSTQEEVKEVSLNDQIYKVGIISVPSFYLDFSALQKGDRNAKSTSNDINKILQRYNKEGVDAVIMDLRQNGGGSLYEANKVTGLFIDRGPTVQVKSLRGGVDVQQDRSPGASWNGPLMVMTDRLSASASEIFAGAIQDYGRGIIVGDTTYGKGTVQSLGSLSFGEIKLTQAMFYRINGESTQHRGVVPDIKLSSYLQHDKIGESALDFALPFNQIKKARYASAAISTQLINNLIQVQQNEFSAQDNWQATFAAIKEQRQQQDSIDLNLKSRQQLSAQRKEQKASILADLELEEDASLYDHADNINLQQALTLTAHWLEAK